MTLTACHLWLSDQLDVEPLWLADAVCLGEPGKAVVALHDYRRLERGASVEVSVATARPKYLGRDLIRSAFRYAFGDLGVTRLHCRTAASNRRCQRLVEGLGFVREGRQRGGWDGIEDAVLYSVLAGECRRWLART